MSDAYKQKQAALTAETIKKQDMVITTALIPGRPAPVLITEEMVASMKPGSVIVDLAVDNGGNCALSEGGKAATTDGGVTVVAYYNVPSRLATDASALYAKNLYNFIELLIDKEKKELAIDWDDDIVKGTLIARDGAVVHPAFAAPEPKAEEPKPEEPKAEEPKAEEAKPEQAEAAGAAAKTADEAPDASAAKGGGD